MQQVVIVSCHQCGTRYRHAPVPGATASCGRCEAQVPLRAARRSYVVASTVPAPIGADDPGLREAGLPPSLERAVPYSAPAEPRALDAAVPPPGATSATADSIELQRVDFDHEVAAAAAAAEQADLAAAEAAAAGTDPAEAAEAPRKGRALGWLAFLPVLAGGAAAGGWFGALELGEVDPVLYASGAGTVGALVGWVLYRWRSSRR